MQNKVYQSQTVQIEDKLRFDTIVHTVTRFIRSVTVYSFMCFLHQKEAVWSSEHDSQVTKDGGNGWRNNSAVYVSFKYTVTYLIFQVNFHKSGKMLGIVISAFINFLKPFFEFLLNFHSLEFCWSPASVAFDKSVWLWYVQNNIFRKLLQNSLTFTFKIEPRKFC